MWRLRRGKGKEQELGVSPGDKEKDSTEEEVTHGKASCVSRVR